ncbi:MAG: NADH-quinone oxidoreductase subunit A [Candidatus Marsarchaeota archaeon]|nr:NADH-quinone oxidoreductase subunit A [Candidatus Marsarchaeota archaeon]
MLYDYVALVFFGIVSILFPLSIVLTSMSIRKRKEGNSVKSAPYESGEESIGEGRIVDTEYLPFMMLFLPLEVVSILILMWSEYAYETPYVYGVAVVGLLGISALFSAVGYKVIGDNHGT